MKVTFGAVEKPAPTIKVGDFVFPNIAWDRVFFVREREEIYDADRGKMKVQFKVIVMNPGYNYTDLGREIITDLSQATPFDSAELIVRR